MWTDGWVRGLGGQVWDQQVSSYLKWQGTHVGMTRLICSNRSESGIAVDSMETGILVSSFERQDAQSWTHGYDGLFRHRFGVSFLELWVCQGRLSSYAGLLFVGVAYHCEGHCLPERTASLFPLLPVQLSQVLVQSWIVIADLF